MTTPHSTPPSVLMAGRWLGAWAWDDVLEHLDTDQYRAVAITFPGLDPEDPARTTKTLTDQTAAIVDALSPTRRLR